MWFMTKVTSRFTKNLIQYKAALAITGALRGSSTEKLYQELVLENIQSIDKLLDQNKSSLTRLHLYSGP